MTDPEGYFMGLINAFGPPVAMAVLLGSAGTGIRRRSSLARTWIWILGYIPPPLYITFFSLVAEPNWRYKYGHHYASLLETGPGQALVNLVLLAGMALYMFRAFQADDQQRVRRSDILVQGMFTVHLVYFALMGALVYKMNFFVLQPMLYAMCHLVILYQLVGRGLEPRSRRDWKVLGITLGSTAIGFAIKEYLAWKLFYSLPETPPRMCVMVTAASKGHPAIVGSWYDAQNDRIVNRQLLFFYRFEDWLMAHYPQVHRWLRKRYNRHAPALARRIDRRWKADLVYMALKPLQALLWIGMTVTLFSGPRRSFTPGN